MDLWAFLVALGLRVSTSSNGFLAREGEKNGSYP